jgi:hypothetical protein
MVAGGQSQQDFLVPGNLWQLPVNNTKYIYCSLHPPREYSSSYAKFMVVLDLYYKKRFSSSYSYYLPCLYVPISKTKV